MRIKNNTSVKLGIMISITLLTQLVIMIRASIIASKFGTSIELDAFNFANSISMMIFSFIGTGVTTVLIPNLGKKEKKKAVDIFILILYLGATILLFLGLIFNKHIVVLFSENNDKYFIDTASAVMSILLISQYIASFIGLTNSILQFQNKFNRSKFVIFISNIILIIILMFNKEQNIYSYANAILISTIINILIQFILVIISGFKIKFQIDIKDKDFRNMIRTFLPTILSTGLYQISLVIDTSIASGLGEGNISILNYSNYIIGMINMLLIVNITSFLYPKIAKNIKKNNYQQDLVKYILIINAILSYIIISIVVVGKDAIELLYMRGQFENSIVNIVYICTIIYIISLPMSAIRDVIYKYFYANSDTYTPFKNSFLISVLNIILSIILSRYIGVYGVVIGTTLTSIISLILIGNKFKIIFGIEFDYKKFFRENIKILISSLGTILIVMYIRKYFKFDYNLINILVYSIISILIYILNLIILKCNIFKMKI
ncbi:integral membrane protein MviN [Clostridium thermobutyricum]|uniref:Integral membrane protein MviN n=1 Tax=Clostridium thermobutyricum TaxID=29372 RepID=N9Y5U0_9CLOT|nr:lipid II flippase MurJ [Clostridium thermobutyricum]ENZ03147.1 integral membrane protein MviN [Clostridium thermobutyricum]